MAIEQYHTWGWKGFSTSDLESWVPAFGKWCGPGWSAGERIKTIKEEHKKVRPAFIPDTNQDSPIDAICKDHDIEYERAKGKIDEKARKLAADIVLIEKLARLDKSRLTLEEIQYCFAMEYLFKITTYFSQLTQEEEIQTRQQPLDEETQKQIVQATQVLFEEASKKMNELADIAKQTSNKVFDLAFPEMKREMEAKLADFMKNTAQKKKNHSPVQKQTKAPESSYQKSSKHQQTATSTNILSGIMTPENLFNRDGALSERTFASTKRRDFVQESVDTVLRSQYTHQYDPADFDFLFKNEAVFFDKEEKTTDEKSSDEEFARDNTIRARARNYA